MFIDPEDHFEYEDRAEASRDGEDREVRSVGRAEDLPEDEDTTDEIPF